jgi:hypothetical protein
MSAARHSVTSNTRLSLPVAFKNVGAQHINFSFKLNAVL